MTPLIVPVSHWRSVTPLYITLTGVFTRNVHSTHALPSTVERVH